MTIAVGTRFGHYEITGALGAGGMGEVYRARDTKLGREVAIKTLPAGLATDANRLARFEREAKLLAALNHAHIATIYGLDEHGGRRYLAMELVEGETLEDRLIEAGALPVEDALQLALQIAQALEAAHDKGVVHRDLKPANVMITKDGVVKVLDFGLAKVFATETEGAAAGNSPALSLAMTEAGLIVGTAGYMAPEQASGQATDQRADVWAFGVVLYEMLTGQPVFKGESVPHILADVLKSAPDWSALPNPLHPRIALLLERCLRKKPRDRYHSIADVRVDIEDVLEDPAGATALTAMRADAASAGRLTLRRVGSGAALAAIGAAAAGFGAWQLKPAPPPEQRQVARFTETYAAGTLSAVGRDRTVAISRDGRQILFRRPGAGGLYLRSMATGELTLIPGSTVGAQDPTFSPDGSSVAFRGSDSQLKRLAVSGGVPVGMGPEAFGQGVSWSRNGTILYSRGDEIRQVPENGGDFETLVKSDASASLQQPQRLPVGDWILYVALRDPEGSLDASEIVIESPSTGEREVLRTAATDARYVASGHIVYASGGVLYALPFDVRRLEVTGNPVPVVQGVASGTPGLHQFDVSDSGDLVYLVGLAATETDLRIAITDTTGKLTAVDIPSRVYGQVRSAPNGRMLAFDTNNPSEGRIIWLYETAGTSAMRRLTFEGSNRHPVWSPDSERIAFQSDRGGDRAIYAQRVDGAGGTQRLTTPAEGEVHIPESWSPDGRFLSFSVQAQSTRTLWILSVEDGSVSRFGSFDSGNPIGSVFSPDGRWLAYAAVPSGTVTSTSSNSGVYVEPFPATGARYQAPKIVRDYHPVWSPDGTALHFIGSAPSAQIVTVTVAVNAGVTFGTPTMTPFTLTAGRLAEADRPFDVLPDGRFVGPVSGGALDRSEALDEGQVRIVQNWFEELRRLVPTEPQ